jgi:hypothetical protein
MVLTALVRKSSQHGGHVGELDGLVLDVVVDEAFSCLSQTLKVLGGFYTMASVD